MNVYAGFFITSINAHFVGLLIPLYRLFENKADTYNIPRLLADLRHGALLPTFAFVEIDNLNKQALPLWEKVKVLRNRAFGHRSRSHTTAALFKEADMSPDNLKALIDTSKKILNIISQAWQNDTHEFNADASKDTIKLLNDLKEFNARKRH